MSALVRALAVGAACLAIGLACAQAAPVQNSAAAASLRRTGGSSGFSLTASQLAGYLRAAAFITQTPVDLTPPLINSGPLIVRNGCQLSLINEVKSKPCAYGDTTAHTSVVLFGDSHAGAWFPALDQISSQRHWRLLIFTKAGCSPPVVKLYHQCDTWRKNTEAQIAALHPAIVFVSWARWIEAKAKAEAGVPTGYGSPWQNGMAAIFTFLHRSAGRVIFISDVPTLKFGAASCISTHLTDVQACNNTPRRKAIDLPKVRAEEFQLAHRMHVGSIDPMPWFCTPTVCPVLVRNFLVYYDSAHMTTAWSSFIAPVLGRSVTSILRGTAGS
jgi:hypothetical protein